MTHLDELEKKSIFIIREVKRKYKNPALLWSGGKDSTVLLWMIKKSFPKIPFKIVFINTGFQFKEVYQYIDKYSEVFNLNLLKTKPRADIKETSADRDRFECCNARKTQALKQTIKDNRFDAIIVGIRRDEHGVRNKERYFSPRDRNFRWNIVKEKGKSRTNGIDIIPLQEVELDGWDIYATDFGNETSHVRIHPLLHWNETEIWKYIQKENIPVSELYFSKNGQRYRSIGCECCTKPIESDASSIKEIIEEIEKTTEGERDSRDIDKELNMQRLRSLGYM